MPEHPQRTKRTASNKRKTAAKRQHEVSPDSGAAPERLLPDLVALR